MGLYISTNLLLELPSAAILKNKSDDELSPSSPKAEAPVGEAVVGPIVGAAVVGVAVVGLVDGAPVLGSIVGLVDTEGDRVGPSLGLLVGPPHEYVHVVRLAHISSCPYTTHVHESADSSVVQSPPLPLVVHASRTRVVSLVPSVSPHTVQLEPGSELDHASPIVSRTLNELESPFTRATISSPFERDPYVWSHTEVIELSAEP